MSKQLGRRFSFRGKVFPDRLRDLRVQHLALALEERIVGRVLHQGVLEGVDRLGACAPSKHQLGLNQALEREVELRLLDRRYRSQEFVGELPSNASTDLGDLLYRGQAVQTRHQRIPQRGGNG